MARTTAAARGLLPWAVLLAAWAPLLILVPDAMAPAGVAPGGWGSAALFARSLAVAGGAAVLALALGMPLAILLGCTDLPWRAPLQSACLAPLVLPPYIAAIGWLHLLGPRGPWGAWLGAALGITGPFMVFLTPWGAIWVLGLWAYPLATLMGLAALGGLDADLLEHALLSGGWRAAFRSVVWPALLPALGSSALIVAILALGDFGVCSFLGVTVYTAEIMLRFGAFYDVGAGVRVLMPLLLLAVLGCVLVLRGVRRYQDGVERLSLGAPRRAPLGPWRWPCLAMAVAPLLLAVAAPMLALISRAPHLTDYLMAWEAARRQIANSALLGPLAAALALALAWPVARGISRGKPGVSAAVQIGNLTLLAVPGVALGMGLIRLWNRGGLAGWVYGSPLMVVLCGALRGLPLAALALALAWRRLPAEVEEAASVAGAPEGVLTRRIRMPLLRSGIASAAALACYRAMTDLEATVLVHAPGDDTLVVRLYTLQHDGTVEHVAALAVTLVVMTAVMSSVAWWLIHGRQEA